MPQFPSPMQTLFRKAGRAMLGAAQTRPQATSPDESPWERAFAEVYGARPDEEQTRHLDFLAAGSPRASPRERYRAVLAGFDQQVLRTAFTVRWNKDDVELRTVHGFSMYLDGADISVARSIEAGTYEPHVIAFVEAFLAPGMHVVDAGANIGLYSLLAASRVGPAGRVWSFEPNSENCRLLLSSAAANAFTNISLHPVALGNAAGHTYFTLALGSNGGIQDDAHRDLLDESCKIVPLMRLDDFALERVDLLKMDVEGSEALLVQGAQATLQRCRPVIVSEFSFEMLHRIARLDGGEFLAGMQDLGYELFISDKASHRIRPLGDPRAFAAPFAGTGRIEDLVFCPREKTVSLPLRE